MSPAYIMSRVVKQLYGEREGKDQKGIFPASVDSHHGSSLHGAVLSRTVPEPCLRR